MKEAAQHFHFTEEKISECCKKKRDQWKNKHFAYYRDYNENWTPPPKLLKKEFPKILGTCQGREIPVFCLETNIIYPSATKCALSLGVTRTAVCHCCSGRSSKVYKKKEDNTKTAYHLNYCKSGFSLEGISI